MAAEAWRDLNDGYRKRMPQTRVEYIPQREQSARVLKTTKPT